MVCVQTYMIERHKSWPTKVVFFLCIADDSGKVSEHTYKALPTLPPSICCASLPSGHDPLNNPCRACYKSHNCLKMESIHVLSSRTRCGIHMPQVVCNGSRLKAGMTFFCPCSFDFCDRQHRLHPRRSRTHTPHIRHSFTPEKALFYIRKSIVSDRKRPCFGKRHFCRSTT